MTYNFAFEKVLFLEEERILEEFKNVKLSLKEMGMDEEEFDAARETCMVLGGKLMESITIASDRDGN